MLFIKVFPSAQCLRRPCECWNSAGSFLIEPKISVTGSLSIAFVRSLMVSIRAARGHDPLHGHCEQKSYMGSNNFKINNSEQMKKKDKKRLHELFRNAVGRKGTSSEKTGSSGSHVKDHESARLSQNYPIDGLKKKPHMLGGEVRVVGQTGILKETEAIKTEMNMYSLFATHPNPRNDNGERKGKLFPHSEEDTDVNSTENVPPEMILFVNALYKEGYIQNMNILQDGKINLNLMSSRKFQNILKNAAGKFGEGHQDIAKWVSGSELKKVALLGCPATERQTVFAAKSLRSFFTIQEEDVCGACKLKSSCKFVNQKVSKKEKLILTDALRVLTVYGFCPSPKHFALIDERKASVRKLLKEVVDLSS